MLKISRSSYYHRKNHPSKNRYAENEIQAVVETFHKHHGSFGRRILKELLKKQGINISEWKISRIMRSQGLESKYRNKKTKNVYTSKNTRKYIKDNIYPRLSQEEKAKEIWATDFTEEKIEGRKIYTCGIKSINSKVLVGLSMSEKSTSKLAIETLEAAIASFGRPYMILTDRGAQFLSKSFNDTLSKHGIIHSMSRPYCAVDNTYIETFWKTMKTEIGSIKKYTVAEYMLIMDYYWDYYNYRRPHSSLDYEAPIKIKNVI